MAPARNARLCVASAIAAAAVVLWLQAEWRARRLAAEVDRFYVGEVTVRAVDAESNEPVPILVQAQAGGRQSPRFTVLSSDKSSVRVRWFAAGPTEVAVSSNGYGEQRLTLDRDTEDVIVVRLRR